MVAVGILGNFKNYPSLFNENRLWRLLRQFENFVVPHPPQSGAVVVNVNIGTCLAKRKGAFAQAKAPF